MMNIRLEKKLRGLSRWTLRLRNFDFVAAHWSGKRPKAADAMVGLPRKASERDKENVIVDDDKSRFWIVGQIDEFNNDFKMNEEIVESLPTATKT